MKYSSNIPKNYKYDILNVKGNPYYPIRNSINKSRNPKIFGSNSEGMNGDVVGIRLGIPKNKLL